MTTYSARRQLLPVFAAVLGFAATAAFAADKGGDKTAAGTDSVVAIVNGAEIHESSLNDVRAMMPPEMARRAPLAYVVEQAIASKLVSDEARKEGLANDPLVKKRMKQVEDTLLVEAWTHKHLAMNISDDQVKKKYDEIAAQFKPQEELHAHHIVVETEDQAKAIIADLQTGGVFEDIAKTKSKDASAQNGGDLGFFVRGRMVPEFADAAFALKNGEITTTPVKTQFGYHIIRADERRQTTLPPLDDNSKNFIRQQMAKDVVDKQVGEMRSKAKVDIKIAMPAPGEPGGMPAPAPKQ